MWRRRGSDLACHAGLAGHRGGHLRRGPGPRLRARDRLCGTRARALGRGGPECLGTGKQFNLVTTHYAHPAMPQLAFYERISDWVAPGGTLLIVGHLHTPDTTGTATATRAGPGNPPEEASVTAAGITARLDATQWDVVTAEEYARTLTNRAGRTVQLRDVVVRATRRP